MPDIIIMRERSGVYIIEVKDWNLNKYSIGPKLKWHLQSNEQVRLTSPIDQVNSYKSQLYKLHIPGLALEKLKNKI